MTRNSLLIASLAVALAACAGNGKSKSTGPSAVSDTAAALSQSSASEIALATVSGSVADAEGVTTELARLGTPSLWHGLADMFAPAHALAAPMTCPLLSNLTLADCSAGKLTLSLDDCQYLRRSGELHKAVWKGSKILDFGATCPKRLAAITTVTRTVGTPTTRTAADGNVLTIDTDTPSGYDTQISPQPSGGSVITHTTAGRTIEIKGIHYLAADKSGERRWDHTVSTAKPVAVTIERDGTRLVSGTVTVQHNLKKFTAEAELSDVAFDFAQCGCLPISGSITTTLTGSKTGVETLDITSCGQAQLTDSNGVTSAVTLTHCL